MRSCLLALTWLGAVVLLALQRGSARAAPGAVTTTTARHVAAPRLARGLVMQDGTVAGSPVGARYTRDRGTRRPVEGLVLLDELEAAADEDKRQFDDYGHMRFGKRGPQRQAAFDDYGHMRFGRAGGD